MYELKAEGLIAQPGSRQKWLPWATSVAASLLFFLVGNFWGKASVQEARINPEQGYVMLLHEDENFRPGDPMEMFNEYAAWMNTIDQMGVKITGQELQNYATILTATSTKRYGENVSKRTTGYFIIEAENESEALKIAQQNPHLKYGGTIELKPFIVRK